MSIYLVSIQVLNLVCTTSSDGIGKVVLRFFEKYKLQNKLEDFFSSILWLSAIIYILIWGFYIFSHDYIYQKFAINNLTFIIILLLVIPCGIRQFLYQILRVYNKVSLYTFSIILYQITFIIFIITLVKKFPNANTVLLAMTLAIVFIDFYIIKKISIPFNIKLYIDRNIISEILRYTIPLFFTNACYWVLLNISKFIFQYMQEYDNTAISGATASFANLVLQPLATVFIFSSFPVIVKKYELRKKLRIYYTNLVQLYCAVFIPLICGCCFYTHSITHYIFPNTYSSVYLILPFYIISICLHELTKLVNVKYHLKNIMHIESIVAFITAITAIVLNLYMIRICGLIGAAMATCICELMLLLLNLLIKSKKLNYVSYYKIFKTSAYALFASFIIFNVLSLIFTHKNTYSGMLEIFLFFLLSYYLCYTFRQKILY